MLNTYFNGIITRLSAYEWIRSVDVIRHSMDSTDEKDILLYRLRAHLADGSLLEMMERLTELKTGGTDTTKYSFHWQDAEGKLIKRWDNAPHFPDVPTYPFHVHLGEERVESSHPQTGFAILERIDEEFSRL